MQAYRIKCYCGWILVWHWFRIFVSISISFCHIFGSWSDSDIAEIFRNVSAYQISISARHWHEYKDLTACSRQTSTFHSCSTHQSISRGTLHRTAARQGVAFVWGTCDSKNWQNSTIVQCFIFQFGGISPPSPPAATGRAREEEVITEKDQVRSGLLSDFAFYIGEGAAVKDLYFARCRSRIQRSQH